MLRKPKILLLVDRPGWIFDTIAIAIVKYLSDDFEFRINYVVQEPDLTSWPFDLLYIFFWGENYHKKFHISYKKIIKEVSSFRWANEKQYGYLTPEEFVNIYLVDAGTITATSQRMVQTLSPYRKVLLMPNGFDPATFANRNKRMGPLRIGWAGNYKDRCKGVKDILIPAAGRDYKLILAKGKIKHKDMQDFYNSIDVFAISSTAEGQPITLIEAMACGCYPICVNVGIVPELVIHGKNGLIIDRTIQSFRDAFQWCDDNKELIRQIGNKNANDMLVTRSWPMIISQCRSTLMQAI